MREPPTELERCLAILVLRRAGCVQDSVASIARCGKPTVGAVERWFSDPGRLPYSEAVKLCDDTAIKRVINIDLVPSEEVDKELLEKLLQITGDDILRHYRADYLKVVDISDPRFLKHTVNVLNLLNIYVSQLRMGYEPEDFLSLPEKGIPNGRWLDYWAYVKDIVPSIDRLIDKQINSERICITRPLEIEPSFVALEGHYEGTKLWEDINNYKRARDAYAGAGVRLHKIVTTEISRFSLQVPEETKVVLEALRNLVQIKATQTRVKLNLQLIETDWGTVLKNLPDASGKALQRFLEFVNKYKNKPYSESKNDVQETQDIGKLILELMDRLEKNYEPVKRLYKAITRAVEGEKLKGTLPPGTKCKFCPSV